MQNIIAQNNDFDHLPVKVILFPFTEATISATVDGVVEKYNFREGKAFTKGAVLVSIVSLDYQEKLDKATAILNELKRNYTFMQKIYNANLELRKKGMFSKMALEKNKLDMDIAFIRIKSALAEKNLAERKLNSCKITAPFSGRVEEIIINEHEYIRNGEPLVTIIDDNRLLALMHLPANLKSKMNIGQKLSFKISKNNKIYTGEISEIAARINHRSRTFEIKLVLDNSKSELTAGMSGILINDISKTNKRKKLKNDEKLKSSGACFADR
jgi:membrane fusion protein, multidrug efflux system